MTQRFVLGLDLGGSGIRALLCDVDGEAAWASSRRWQFQPDADAPMALVFDPTATWNALGEAVHAVCARAGARPEQVVGVAATSMRHGSVLLAADGAVLLAAPNRDARGALEMLGIGASHGEVLQQRTGHWPNSIMPAGRLRWLAAQRPDTLERAAVHLALSDWVAWRLCDEAVTEPSQAAETPLVELARAAWADDLIAELGLPRRLFPALRRPGERLGGLTPEAAAHLGLRAATPVAVGGADTQCGLLGARVVAPGAVGIVAGTSAPVQRVLDQPSVDPEGRLWTSYHVLDGRWTLESNAGGVGESLDWIAGVLHAGKSHPVLHLLDDAARSAPGAAGMLSTLCGQVMNARALSLPLGNLTLSPVVAADDPERRRHVARAVVEGLACALRANAEQVAAVSGELPERLRLTGGLSRSSLLAQILADVLGRAVEVTRPAEATALGAAICAGVGAGLYADLEEGARALVRVERCHEPGPDAPLYAERYAAWSAVREQAAPADATAAGLVMQHLAGSVAAAARPAASFRPKILVSADLDPASLEALARVGEVEEASYRKRMRMLTGPSLVQALRGVHVFVTEIDVVGADALAECDDLRAIVACRGDAVNVDLEACTALGIPVVNTPGRNADAVADLAVAFLLMLARRLPQANAFLRAPGGRAGDMARMAKAFGTLQGRELWRKTVGLVGLGAVGRKVVERLSGFGARCLVFDPFLSDDAVRLSGAEPGTLDEVLAASDFVSLHAAVTDSSRGLIGERELGLMKPGSFLVNTARAALVDEAALRRALDSGHLAGAALDVFAVEPPGSDDPLLALPQVVATPHVGGNTSDVSAHQGRIAVEEVQRLLRGERPRHPLNPSVLEGYSISAPRPRPAPELLERLGRGPGPAVTDLQKQDLQKQGPQKPAAAAPSPPGPGASAPPAADAAAVRERFERVLRAFVAALPADDGLRRAAAGAGDVTLHFAISDLGSEFHLGFRDGTAFAALGAPQTPAPVRLELEARLLDGMFTGRANPMEAAMNGELSFSGDAAKAMALNQLQGDLERLYRAAREQAGDPGDLSALAAPRPRAAAPARSASPGPSDEDLRDELLEVVRELFAAQLITATGGNVSARGADGAEEAWITPSRLFKGDLSRDVLVRIGLDARPLDTGGRSPSSEALMHTAVLRARPEVRAVIHCHAPYATVLANAGLPFLPVSTEAAFFTNIGRIPFVMPGTQALADAVVEALGEGWAVLMQNHGLLVAGRSLRRAADMAEIIERTCQVILGCHAVGAAPPTLPEETVKMLARYGDLLA